MGVLDGFVEAFDADVGIDLGGGKAGVAKELLYRFEVGAAIEEVGGEGVAQSVGGGVGRESDRKRPTLDDLLDGPSC